MDYIVNWALLIALFAGVIMLCAGVAAIVSFAIRDIRNNLKR